MKLYIKPEVKAMELAPMSIMQISSGGEQDDVIAEGRKRNDWYESSKDKMNFSQIRGNKQRAGSNPARCLFPAPRLFFFDCRVILSLRSKGIKENSGAPAKTCVASL